MKSNRSISLDDDIWNDLIYESKNKNIPLSQLVEDKVSEKKENAGGDIYTLHNTIIVLNSKLMLLCNEMDILLERDFKKKEEELKKIKKQQEEEFNKKKVRVSELMVLMDKYRVRDQIIKLDLDNKEEVTNLIESFFKSSIKIGLSQIIEYKRLTKELGILG